MIDQGTTRTYHPTIPAPISAYHSVIGILRALGSHVDQQIWTIDQRAPSGISECIPESGRIPKDW